MKNSSNMILDLLQEEKKLYASLLKKLEAQKKAVDKKEDEALPVLLEAKDALAKAIHQTDKQIREQFQKLTPPQKTLLASRGERARQSIEDMLGQIVEIENYCHAELLERQAGIVKQFKKIREGRVLTKGYRFAQKKRPKFSRSV